MKNDKYLRILSLYFYPDIATTGQLLTELASGLADGGYEVRVITAQPSYEKKKTVASENYHGINIRRVWSTQFNKNTFSGKILNSVSFFFSSLWTVIMSSDRSPLLIVSNPPFLPFIGALSNFLHGTNFIFLVHDIYPDIAVNLRYLKRNGIVERMWDFANRQILKRASSIIVLSATMKQKIEQKCTFLHDARPPIEIIHNWAKGDHIVPLERSSNLFLREHRIGDKFIVQYSGNHGLFHKLETIVLAAERCSDKEILFFFIGDGGKKQILVQMAAERKLSNIMFLPYQDIKVLPQSLTAASVAVVTLEENIEGLAMPSKLYTILASGTPVIALCDQDSAVAEIVRDAQCGLVVRQDDADGFLDAVRRLKEDRNMLLMFGANARKYFETHFSFDIALQKYRSVIDRFFIH